MSGLDRSWEAGLPAPPAAAARPMPPVTGRDAEIEAQIPALRRYAFALAGSRDQADDLVQDCLERALTRWDLRRDADPRPWLFTILHNLFISALRRRRPEAMADDAAEQLAGPDDPELVIEAGQTLAALHRLPEEQRAVLLLIAVEDLSYAEAAAILAIPVGTVMSRLARARARLRQLMAGPARPTRSRS